MEGIYSDPTLPNGALGKHVRPVVHLCVRRAKDREQMAAAVVAALTAAGATCTREELPREIAVWVQAPGDGGAKCCVDFDGDSPQPGTWVVTWNTEARMSAIMGDVNTFHRRKATRVFHDFVAMLAGLASDIARFADGSAYEDRA